MEFEDREAFEAALFSGRPEKSLAIACRSVARNWLHLLDDRVWQSPNDVATTEKRQKVALTWAMRLLVGLQRWRGSTAEIHKQASLIWKVSDYNGLFASESVHRSLAAIDSVARAAAQENGAEKVVARFSLIAIDRSVEALAIYAQARFPRPNNESYEAVERKAWKAVYQDAAFLDMESFHQPLWHEAGWPVGLAPDDIGPTLLNTDPRFSFFKRWYDGLVCGEPTDWQLQRRVALIPRDVWEAGPDSVAEAIAEIEAQHLREKASLAERVEFNEDNNRFRVVPIAMQNAAFMSALMSRTADALDDALHGNNGLRDDMREVRVLRRTHDRYSNDPQRVEMDYTSVAISLRRNLDAKELAESDDNLALLEAVEDGVRGLRAHHPEVAANREALAKQAMRELPVDQIALLEDAQDVLPEITEGAMQEDFARDIPKLINDATLPLPSGAPRLPGADEATRIFSRSAGIKLLYAKACENGATVFDSKEFKTVRLGLTVSGLLSALSYARIDGFRGSLTMG